MQHILHILGNMAGPKAILHDVELRALVERDDMAARLLAAGKGSQKAGTQKYPISTNIDFAGSADESAAVRYNVRSGFAIEPAVV